LFRQSVDAFFETNHLVFEIRDYDAIGGHGTLGTVNVSKHDILKGTGERMEYKISLEDGLTVSDSKPVSTAFKLRKSCFVVGIALLTPFSVSSIS
jgi:hypothetical protein